MTEPVSQNRVRNQRASRGRDEHASHTYKQLERDLQGRVNGRERFLHSVMTPLCKT